MKNLNITSKELIKGDIFEIETIDKSDLRIAELSFNEHLNKFCIWFNGQLIHTSKTFKALTSRLAKLDQKFPLESHI